MERSSPIISTKAAVIAGFLLLGLLAIAVWLVASASPASAQTDDTTAAPEPASTDQSATQEPPSPAPPESPAPPLLDLELNPPDLPPLPVDLTTLTQTVVRPVTEVLPPALQPVVEDVSELLPAPVREPLAPFLPKPAPPPSGVAVGPAKDLSPGESIPVLPDPSVGAAGMTTAPTSSEWSAKRAPDNGELRASDTSSHESGTRAPPPGFPSPVVAQSSALSSSTGRDFGQSLLLFGVVAAGVLLVLGRGRRLWREATGWLPASWCLLIERPG